MSLGTGDPESRFARLRPCHFARFRVISSILLLTAGVDFLVRRIALGVQALDDREDCRQLYGKLSEVNIEETFFETIQVPIICLDATPGHSLDLRLPDRMCFQQARPHVGCSLRTSALSLLDRGCCERHMPAIRI